MSQIDPCVHGQMPGLCVVCGSTSRVLTYGSATLTFAEADAEFRERIRAYLATELDKAGPFDLDRIAKVIGLCRK